MDLDGLLIDSEKYMWGPSMRGAAADQGFDLTDELHNAYMGMGLQRIQKILEETFGEKFDFEKFYRRSLEINREIITRDGLPLMKGAMELLDYLQEKNIYSCVGTSTRKEMADFIFEAAGITNKITKITYGEEVIEGKPSPDIYLKCFNKFDVKKEESVVYEDSGNGGLSALNAGIRLILVPDFCVLSDDVLSRAFAVCKDLTESIDIIDKENNGMKFNI